MMNKQEWVQEETGFVFIHGAGLKGKIWSKVAERLDQPCLLVEYPLVKDSVESEQELSLAEYVTHMKRQVDEWGVRRFIIVAHSLGGVLALRLASGLGDRLAGFVAVSAAIPKNGGSFLSVLPLPKRILMKAILSKMGTKPPASAIRAGLCNDLSPEHAEEVVQGFKPESIRVYTDRTEVSVPDVPRLYITLEDDKEFTPSFQKKMISNLSPQSVRSLKTGHLPMLSEPDGLSHILQEFSSDVEGIC
ncbi:alpha/beta fold hydrolase [Paenibacillus tarimensis]